MQKFLELPNGNWDQRIQRGACKVFAALRLYHPNVVDAFFWTEHVLLAVRKSQSKFPYDDKLRSIARVALVPVPDGALVARKSAGSQKAALPK